MSFLAFGINHKTASVEIREKVAFDLTKLDEALSQLISHKGVSEAVILSTCNRTEIYCYGEQDLQVESVKSWLADFHDLAVRDLDLSGFSYVNEQVVSHVMRVAAGLDSLVLGEPQILGQLKSAYACAADAGSVGGPLGRLFERSFSVAKKIRTETAIGENPVSVASAAVNMARQLFDDFSNNNALLIGAGKTTELVARHLRQAGVKKIRIANRTLARAQELCGEVEGEAALLGDIPDLLCDTDIVISSTASALPILGKGAVERAMRTRKHRPIFMVDIAVPRDIEPQVSELDDVFLYTVDDLKQVIDDNLKSREQAASEAEALVEEGSNIFLKELRASGAGDVLKRFRSHAEQMQQEELRKAVQSLNNGGDAEAVLRGLARSLTNKLIHEPTIQVRHAASHGRNDAGEWLLTLFGVEGNDAEED